MSEELRGLDLVCEDWETDPDPWDRLAEASFFSDKEWNELASLIRKGESKVRRELR